MKNTPLHIDENELDLLLRQMTLDERADEFTQNSLVMNAEIIFGREGTPSVSITATKEKEMIAKLEEAFVKRKGFGKFWLNGIIVTIILSVSGWIYKTNSGSSASSSLPENSTQNFIPASKDDSSEGKTNPAPDKIIYTANYAASQNDSVTAGEDTALHVSATLKKEHYITADSHIPIEKNWYAGEYVANNIPGPVFSAKPSPENFKAVRDTFEINGKYPGVMYMSWSHELMVPYYTGEPFKSSSFSDMLYFNLGDYYSISKKYGNFSRNSWQLPWQTIEYADPDSVVFRKDTINGHVINSLYLHQLPEKALSITTAPFYFRRYEVTNKEYREFVNWVRASNGYADKPIEVTTIDTVLVTDPKDKSGEQIAVKGKNYRIVRKTTPTEDYKDVFNYVFFNTNADAVKSLGKNSVYIYPDTLSWVTDFTFSYNEPMTNMYFWHPAYDNYPVVGVSWYQAMAFLDWKTHFHQQQLDAENIPYEIEYTLPSDIEWDLVLSAEKTGKDPVYDFWNDATCDWMTNLGLSYPGHDDPYQRPNYLKNLFIKDEYYRGDFIADGFFHTGPADLSHGKTTINGKDMGPMHVDPLGISWMDGNVSEWMLEDYAHNWKPFFDKHLALLAMDSSESSSIARQIELLYDKGNATNGRLVRGSNWYDERFSGRPGSQRNEAGISPKRFVDPAEQHSTVGFRYVVHVRRK
jgi:formylglycine-generating enzyme required for sulfatase activity